MAVARQLSAAPSTPAATSGFSRQLRWPLALVALGVALAAAVVLATCVGPVPIAPGETVQILLHHVFSSAPPDGVHAEIVWQFRLPRVLVGVVVGAALSVVGVVLQAVVRNPLADPYVLGVSSGAACAAVLVLVFGSAAAGGLGLSAAAFLGALFATLLVYVLAQRAGRVTPFRLVLAGVALAYFFQAAYSLMLLHASPYNVQGILTWLFGSLGAITWSQVGGPALAVAVGTTYLLAQARSLNSLLAGEEAAVSLGLDIGRFRVRMLLVTSLLVGVTVAVSGAVAFVGLIVPHVCRLVIGSNHRRLLPVSVLVGATFLVLMDLAARTVLAPTELPLSIVTAAFGVPFFLWLLRQRETGTEARFG